MIGYLRVPKTGSTAVNITLRSRTSFTGEEYCARLWHYPASFFLEHDHDHQWVTMVRDPYQQIQSFHAMYHRMWAKAKDDPDWKDPLRNHPQSATNVALMGKSIEEYMDQCEPNQFYWHYYAPLNPLDFTFVGRTEEYDRSMALMHRTIGTSPMFGFDGNPNPDKKVGEPYPPIEYSEADWKAKNPLDYEMYELALERFSQLCTQHNV
jgi:hypothetical protein